MLRACPSPSRSPSAAGDVGSSQDLLEQDQSAQAGLFGVLYTLAKEKVRPGRSGCARLVHLQPAPRSQHPAATSQ